MTWKELQARVTRFAGATVVRHIERHQQQEFEVVATAPPNYLWYASMTHEMIVEGRTRDGETLAAVYADMCERVNYGIIPCSDMDCEWCADEVE